MDDLDPSRRRTEFYIQGKDFQDHIKLREHTDDNLRLIEKLQRETYERTSASHDKAEDKVDELIAANAATQATISAQRMRP